MILAKVVDAPMIVATTETLMTLGEMNAATTEADIGQKQTELETDVQAVATETVIELEMDAVAVTREIEIEIEAVVVIETLRVGGIGIQIPQTNIMSRIETATSNRMISRRIPYSSFTMNRIVHRCVCV